MRGRTRRRRGGKIVSFDPSTWWGEVAYDLTVLDFHGTCVRGFTGDFAAQMVGRECDIIFNQGHKLLSIEVR